MHYLPVMHAPLAMRLWCTIWLSLANLHQRQESLGVLPCTVTLPASESPHV